MLDAVRSRLVMSSCLLMLATSSLYAADSPTVPETGEEKLGYTLGYRFGAGLRTDDVKVDDESAVRGFRDAMDGKKPALDVNEMQDLWMALVTRKREANLRKSQEIIVRNREESERFLAANGKKDGVVTTESGLQYRILKEGEGPHPELGDSVQVHYVGTFTDGTEFDNSHTKGEPQTVQTDGVIKGWTEALQLMKAGSKWQLFLPPEQGYGRRGHGNRIPPNKVLVFELELLSIKNRE